MQPNALTRRKCKCKNYFNSRKNPCKIRNRIRIRNQLKVGSWSEKNHPGSTTLVKMCAGPYRLCSRSWVGWPAGASPPRPTSGSGSHPPDPGSTKHVYIFFSGGFFWIFKYFIQHYYICRPSDSTVPVNAGIEPRTVATTALAVRPL